MSGNPAWLGGKNRGGGNGSYEQWINRRIVAHGDLPVNGYAIDYRIIVGYEYSLVVQTVIKRRVILPA